MSNQSTFTVPRAILNRLRQALRARGHEETGDQLYLQHPSNLGLAQIVNTGGGCEAYFVNIKKRNDQNVLVVWTSNDGGALPEPNDWIVGVYQGNEITEDALASLSDDDS